MTLFMSTDRPAVDAVRVRARGEIDLDNAYLLRDAVTAILATSRPRRIVVDLAGVRCVDSVGVGVLVACFHAAIACGASLTVTDPSPVVHRQLWVCGLVGLFDLPTPAAVQSMRLA
jgi:anti-anti-sigma factor